MKNINSAGQDVNAWPQDVNRGSSLFIPASELGGDAAVAQNVIPSATKRFVDAADTFVSGIVGGLPWKKAEVLVWLVHTSAPTGNTRVIFSSWTTDHGEDRALIASPETTVTKLLSTADVPTVDVVAINFGIIPVSSFLTAFRLTRTGTHVDDTNTATTDVVGVLLRDADGTQLV